MTRNCRLFIIFFVLWWTHFRKWITSKLPHQFRTNLLWNCMEMHEFTYRKSFEIWELWINIELYWYMKSSDILRYLISYILISPLFWMILQIKVTVFHSPERGEKNIHHHILNNSISCFFSQDVLETFMGQFVPARMTIIVNISRMVPELIDFSPICVYSNMELV